jgi:hypothetical protein
MNEKVLNQDHFDKSRKLVNGWSVWHDDKLLVLSVIDRAVHIERENERLHAENARYREVLEWYADITNHNTTDDSDPFDAPAILTDDGERARNALIGSQETKE